MRHICLACMTLFMLSGLAQAQESAVAPVRVILPTPETPLTPPVPDTPPTPEILRLEPSTGLATQQDLLTESLEDAFDDMDRDDNNLISGAEFAEFYNTSAENTVFLAYDQDRNYLIDRGEFFALSIDGKPVEPEKTDLIDDLRVSPFYP